MILGFVKFQVIGVNYSRFYNEIIKENLPCRSLVETKGVLTFSISVEYSKSIKRICNELNLEWKIIRKKGLFFTAKRLWLRKGILIGAFAALVFCIILSNFVLRFKILSDNNNIKEDILAVLKENGVEPGSFIPNLNYVKLERELKQKVDGISWAGISTSGSTLTIDVVENIEKPETRKTRLPSNLISKKDAVIDKIELYDGQLMTTVGSAVLKGETLVSGTVVNEDVSYKDGQEIKDVSTKYVRSFAKIYGSFYETVVIEQPFVDQKIKISEKNIYKTYLDIFDLQIPMFFSIPEGSYLNESNYHGLSFFGHDIPLGINKVRLNEYEYENDTYSEEEAKNLARDKLSKYEKNFYKEYEIQEYDIKEDITDDGVKITAVYKLHGDIGEETEFFISK